MSVYTGNPSIGEQVALTARVELLNVVLVQIFYSLLEAWMSSYRKEPWSSGMRGRLSAEVGQRYHQMISEEIFPSEDRASKSE